MARLARQVAQAAVGAMEHGTHGTTYPINGYDLSYVELNQIACRLLGRDPGDVVVVPLEAVLPAYEAAHPQTTAAGLEHGVPVVHTAYFQSREAVSDPAETAVLGVQPDDIPAAIEESLRWCVEHPAEA